MKTQTELKFCRHFAHRGRLAMDYLDNASNAISDAVLLWQGPLPVEIEHALRQMGCLKSVISDEIDRRAAP